MPIDVAFEVPGRFVVCALGKVTGAESISALQQIAQDARFKPGCTVLALAQVVTAAPSSGELREIARMARTLMDRGLLGVAIVAEPGFTYGVARMFSALTDLNGVPVAVFLDEREAREHLERISEQAA